jgi:hypothetical protein
LIVGFNNFFAFGKVTQRPLVVFASIISFLIDTSSFLVKHIRKKLLAFQQLVRVAKQYCQLLSLR